MPFFSRRTDPVERFERLVLPHLDTLYAAALRMTRHSHDAEDLVQETCLRAYRFLGQIEDEGRCRPWLLRILTNTFINLYRKAEQAPRTIELEEDLVKAQESHPRSLESVMDDDLKAALDSLPNEYRDAVLMADVDQFTYDEIAQIQKCPVGTVRSRIHRGRGLLRAHLSRSRQQNNDPRGRSCPN